MSRMPRVGLLQLHFLSLVAALSLAAGLASGAEIHDAARAGDAERVRAILAADGAQRAALDAEGATALHLAKNEAVAHLLLEANAPLDVMDAQGRTPVEAAAAEGRVEVAAAIVDHLARTMENAQRLAERLAGAATADAASLAIQNRDLPALTAVLDRNPEVVKQTERQGLTPLECAVIDEWVPGAKLLLERGADPNVRDAEFGGSPLHEAASNGNLELAALLLDHGADIDFRAKEGDTTPLHLAVAGGDGDMIIFLLQRGANAGLKSKTGLTAYDIARGKENDWTINLLGMQKQFGTQRFLAGLALLDAAMAGDVPAVERIAGGDKGLLKFSDSLGKSPLHIAAESGRAEAVTALLRLGADPKAKTAAGKLASELAADNPTRAAFGLAASFTPQEIDAFLDAAAGGKLDALREFLARSPQIIDAQNEYGSTALHYAAGNGMAAAVELLLANGASMKIKNESGRTAKDETKSRLKAVDDPAIKATLSEVLAVYKRFEK